MAPSGTSGLPQGVKGRGWHLLDVSWTYPEGVNGERLAPPRRLPDASWHLSGEGGRNLRHPGAPPARLLDASWPLSGLPEM